MIIDEAIRDLKARIDGEFSIEGIDDCQDMKLGVEALKLLKWIRDGHIPAPDFLLPGETQE